MRAAWCNKQHNVKSDKAKILQENNKKYLLNLFGKRVHPNIQKPQLLNSLDCALND